MDVEEVFAGIVIFCTFDGEGRPDGVAARGDDEHRIDIFGLVFEHDRFMETVGVSHQQFGFHLALEALTFEKHAGIVGVITGVADGQVHVVGVAGIDETFRREFYRIAVVFDAVRPVAATVGDVVGGIGAAVAVCTATTGGTAIHRIDGNRQTFRVGCGDGSRNHSHIFGGHLPGHRVGAGEQEDEEVVIRGADERGILFRTEHVMESERVGVCQKVEIECRAVLYRIALVVLLQQYIVVGDIGGT